MALAEDDMADGSMVAVPRRRLSMWRWRVPLGLVVLLAILLGAAWFSRERIAADYIERQLESYDIQATYEIERIAPDRQVLTNVAVGDPARPDLTVERAVVELRYRFGMPVLGRIALERPRLFGSYTGGKLTFGELDKVLFRDSGEPPGLPDLDLKLVDGRALLETDHGPIGIKVQGEGELDDGFSGIIAAAAPALDGGGCAARGASAYGRVRTIAGAPSFEGPVRFTSLSCPGSALRSGKAAIAFEGALDADFRGVEGKGRLSSEALSLGANRARSLNGRVTASFRNHALNGSYSLAARGIETPQAQVALLTAKGALRGRNDFNLLELGAAVEGNGLRTGNGLDAALGGFADGAAGTLAEPLLRKARAALRREERGSALRAELTLRKTGQVLSLVMPSATLRGRSGATLLSLSRVNLTSTGGGVPRFTGNLATGGEGLPRIAGRMERGPGGDLGLRLRMAEYASGASVLAIPELVVSQARNGSLAFTGRAQANGPLPGGSARGLRLPISGTYSRGGELALWRSCTEVQFDRLELANLRLGRRGITLCPRPGSAILRSGSGGLRIAAGAPSLDIAGTLAATPIRLRSGPVGFAYPGRLNARQVVVALGPAATATNFRISDLAANLGPDLNGSFGGADITLYGVPLDLNEAAGLWRYSGGQLALSEAAFTLGDRREDPRFNPLIARGATLGLQDNIIRAFAELREPATEREVTEVAIVHDLASGTGHADLTVDGILFDRQLQPVRLSRLALGVIANTRGIVSGTGRIDWGEGGVTSTGRFSSNSLDFAAAFGPVKGARGTVVFTDLLGLTTAPNQTIRVASVNPGIEVLDGEVIFRLENGQLLAVEGGSWPFFGGRLVLREVDLNLGISEARRYVFEIEGLDAAQFIAQMELGNLAATGIFDGTIPITFDSDGNGRIEEGHLASRPPGGSVSYVGELTYEDLSPIANFAFDALRSLEYRRMTIAMEGPLTGEIITRLKFDGVRQGAGTKQNFITRRIGKLPFEFRVNVRAQFYQLITSLKSMYDPAFVRDPRELGLLSDDGTRFLRNEITSEEAAEQAEAEEPGSDENPIQP